MIKVVRLSRFRRRWKKLPKRVQEKASKSIWYLIHDRSHPSLGLKRLQRLPGYWEVRVDDDYRIICMLDTDTITLAAIGRHDVLDKFSMN